MIEKLDDSCRELSLSKIQVVCIPVGTFDKVSKDDVVLMYSVNCREMDLYNVNSSSGL
jgi:hypothetical protein